MEQYKNFNDYSTLIYFKLAQKYFDKYMLNIEDELVGN